MLRSRLLLGLMCLLGILLAMGLFSIDKCSSLGKQITVLILDNNSIRNSLHQLKWSGTEMVAALFNRVSGDAGESQRRFTEAEEKFKSALGDLDKKQLTSKEESKIKILQAIYPDFMNESKKFLVPRNKMSDEENESSTQLGKITFALLDATDKLVTAHEESLTLDNQQSVADINQTIRFLLLAMIIAIIVALYTSVRLSRGLIDPLVQLNTTVKRIGEGNLDQTIPILSEDEVGTLARSFNQMTAQLKKYRTSTSDELIRLHRTLRAALASFPDPIFVLNDEGLVAFRNPEADRLAVKLLFSGVRRLPEKVDQKVDEVRAKGEDYLPTNIKDAIRVHLDDQDRFYLPRIVILRDENNVSFGVAVILEEVTRMHLLDEVKSNLVSTVSHELKTPLTSVRMALYLLLEKIVGPLNPKQTELVATAREDADRLLKTLNDLLDLAKLEQGPAQLETKPMSAAELVDRALRNVKEIAVAADVKLIASVSPELKEVVVDEHRIAFVFNNLLTNAIKYSPAGSAIEIRAERDKEEPTMALFTVIDQGPGISAEQCSRIFERFYRVPGTEKPGAGLGLFIAREVIVAHGGTIGVKSIVGQGSKFYFLIPLLENQANPLGNNFNLIS